MQNETPIRNRKKPINKKGVQKSRPRKVSKVNSKSGMKSFNLSNPYQNVPVKSNNQVPRTGFGFPGSIL